MTKEDIDFIKTLEKLCNDYYWEACENNEPKSAARFAVLALSLARLRGYDGD